MSALLLAVLLAAVPSQAAQPCDSDLDSVYNCPEKYYPQPHPASAADKTLLIPLFQTAQLAQKVELAAFGDLQDLKTMMARNPKSVAIEDLLAKQKAFESARVETFRQANLILEGVSDAYGLTPPVTRFFTSEGHYQQTVPWKPRFSECDNLLDNACAPSEKRKASEGKPRSFQIDGKPYLTGETRAWTKSDGKINVFFSAFFDKDNAPNPDNVAGIIAHETIHWVLDAARDGKIRPEPSPWEHYRSESLAFTFQADFLDKLGRPSADLRRLAGQFETQKEQSVGLAWPDVEAWHTGDWLDAKRPNTSKGTGEQPEILEPVKQGSESDFLNSWRDEAAPLLDRFKKDVARERETERRMAAEKARLAAIPAQWHALEDWASTACEYIAPMEYLRSESGDASYVGWVAEENDRRKKSKDIQDAGARDYLLGHEVVVEAKEMESLFSVYGADVSGCRRDVLDMILQARGPISNRWLVEKLVYKKGGGALGVIVRGIATGISTAAGAIVTGIKAPFIAIGETRQKIDPSSGAAAPSSGSGRAPSENNQSRPSHEIEVKGSGINDLRGIASGLRGF